jgi:hypothetical protein
MITLIPHHGFKKCVPALLRHENRGKILPILKFEFANKGVNVPRGEIEFQTLK